MEDLQPGDWDALLRVVADLHAAVARQSVIIRRLADRAGVRGGVGEDAAGVAEDAAVEVVEVAGPTIEDGQFLPTDQCLQCGDSKHGRRTLTCAPCAAERQSAIAGYGNRKRYIRHQCAACGDDFPPSMRYLCRGCSVLYKRWLMDQRKPKRPGANR